jgi:hypothetical protein
MVVVEVVGGGLGMVVVVLVVVVVVGGGLGMVVVVVVVVIVVVGGLGMVVVVVVVVIVVVGGLGMVVVVVVVVIVVVGGLGMVVEVVVNGEPESFPVPAEPRCGVTPLRGDFPVVTRVRPVPVSAFPFGELLKRAPAPDRCIPVATIAWLR